MNPLKEKLITNYSIKKKNILSYFSDFGWNNSASGLQLWNYIESNQTTNKTFENKKFTYATLSSNGEYLLIAQNDEKNSQQKKILVYDLSNGTIVSENTVFTGKIICLDYDAISKVLLYSIERYPATESEFSAIDIFAKKQLWKKNFVADEICLLSESGIVLYSSYSVLASVDIRKGTILGGYGHQFEFVDASALSSSKTTMAICKSGEVKLCNLTTGQVQSNQMYAKASEITFSHNDSYLGIVANENYKGKVLIYNIQNRVVDKTYNYDQIVGSIDFNNDGTHFVITLNSSIEGEIRVCETATGSTVFSHISLKNKVNDAVFCNNDGMIAFVGKSKSGILDVMTGTLKQQIPFKFYN